MTTAAKYGAMDLTQPNGFQYQQLAAPAAATNTVVNVTVTNRNSSDTRIRLAHTSTPLSPQLVTATTAQIPFAVASTSSTGNVLTTQAINIQSTSSSGNIFTMAAIPVTATQQGTNLITCRETSALAVGMPVVFAGTTTGGLVAGTIYYVLTINSSNTFTVSSSWGGPVVYLTSGFGSYTVTPTTTNLVQNLPVVFNLPSVSTTATAITSTGNYVTLSSTANLYPGSSIVFSGTTFTSSNIVSGTTYYVATTPSRQPIQLANVSRSVSTVTVNTGYAYQFTGFSYKQYNTTTGTWLITFTIASVTTAPLTGITYTVAGNSNTSYNGSFVAVASTQTSITLAYTSTDPGTYGSGTTTAVSLQNHGLTSGQTVAITGTTALGITDEPSVVVTVASATQFTYTSSGSGTVTQISSPSAIATPAPQITISASNGGSTFVLGTTATGSMTVTANNATYGGVTANITYFINTIPSSTTFTVSAVSGSGTAVTLTSATGLMTVSPSTASLQINQPVYLQGPTITVVSSNGTQLTTLGNTGILYVGQPIEFYGYTYGGIVAGITYYVKSVDSAFTFTLAATSGGPTLSWSTFTYPMTATVGIGTALAPLTTYYVSTIPSLTTFTLSTTSGGAAATLANVTQYAATLSGNLVTLGAGTTANLQPNQQLTFNGTSAGNIQTQLTTSALGNTPFIITSTTSGSPGYLTTASTVGLVANQPIQFFGNSSNTVFGTGITTNTVYYVLSVINSTTFSISTTPGGTGLALSSTSGTMYCMPSYYVGAITSSTHFTLIPFPGTTIANTLGQGTNLLARLATTTTFNSLSQAQLTVTPLPMNTDFLEYDAIIAPNGILERTGVLMPPNTYLYVSSSASLVNAVAVGIQEAV